MIFTLQMSYLCTTINLYTFSKFWLFLAKKGKIEGTFRQFELQSTGKFSFLRLLLTDNPAHCIALFAYYYYSMRISKWTPPIRGLVAWCGMFLAQSLQRIPTTMPGVRSRNWIHTKGLDKKEREREVLSSKKRELFRHKRNNYLSTIPPGFFLNQNVYYQRLSVVKGFGCCSGLPTLKC